MKTNEEILQSITTREDISIDEAEQAMSLAQLEIIQELRIAYREASDLYDLKLVLDRLERDI